MPAKSRSMQRFMGACAHSDHPPANCPSKEVAQEFSKGKHANLPERVKKKKR